MFKFDFDLDEEDVDTSLVVDSALRDASSVETSTEASSANTANFAEHTLADLVCPLFVSYSARNVSLPTHAHLTDQNASCRRHQLLAAPYPCTHRRTAIQDTSKAGPLRCEVPADSFRSHGGRFS